MAHEATGDGSEETGDGSVSPYFTHCPNLTCKVTEGSEAQKFCEENEIRYEIQKQTKG